MTNILPKDTRTALVRTARAKFIAVGAVVVLAAGLVAIFAILPAFFLAYIPRAALEESAQQTTSDTQTESDRAIAARTRAILGAVGPLVAEKPSAEEAIAAALAATPSSISVGSISYRSGTPGTIVISGSAKSREQVNAYREALQKDSHFQEVSIPVAALVGTLAGSFTVTLTGPF